MVAALFRSRFRVFTILGAAGLVLLSFAAAPAQAGSLQLLTAREINSNLTYLNGPTASRGNLAIYEYGGWYTGDAFWFAPGIWYVDSITTYAVGVATTRGVEFSDVTLYGGSASTYTGLSTLATGTYTFNTNDTNNPNIITRRVYYTGDVNDPVSTVPNFHYDYVGPTDYHYALFEITFSHLNWMISGNQWVYLAVSGNPGPFGINDSLGFGEWMNHFSAITPSNRTGSGVELGADGLYDIFYSGDNFASVWSRNANTLLGSQQVDMNALVWAYDVPEPATFVLLGGGLVALALIRRRRA